MQACPATEAAVWKTSKMFVWLTVGAISLAVSDSGLVAFSANGSAVQPYLSMKSKVMVSSLSCALHSFGMEEPVEFDVDADIAGSDSGSKKKKKKKSKKEMCFGSDLNFCLDVSCSDTFPGGFGDKAGPNLEENSDDWEVLAYFVSKKKKKNTSKSEKPDKTCGALLSDVEIFNVVTASFQDFNGNTQLFEADDVVIIERSVEDCSGSSKSGSCKSGDKGSDKADSEKKKKSKT